jgi:inorganic pyrophosphatase
MKLPISEMPVFEAETGRLNAIIETPKGVRNKYKYDPDSGLFKFSKMLPLGAAFPFDFGFIPSTQDDDGDPLDVMVLMEEPTFCGCLVTSRLVGVIEAEQTEKGKTMRNDRLIGVPENEQTVAKYHSLEEMDSEILDQIEHFFISYNQMEGKKFTPLRRCGPKTARELIEQHIAEPV